MRRPRPWQVLLVSTSLLALLGPASRPAAAAAVVTSCSRGISTLTVKTCLTITGSGDFIESAMPSATALDADGTLDNELIGPSSSSDPFVDRHSGFMRVQRGQALGAPYWCPDGIVPPGTYGVITRRRSSDGTVTKVGEATITLPI